MPDPKPARKKRSGPARPWWATWWAAAAWFVLTLLAVSPAVLYWLAYIFLVIDNQAGLDIQVESGIPPMPLRVLALVATVAALALPVLMVRWSRKIWLGYTMLGGIVALVIALIGLSLY
ncbi:hypothetical protein [Tessaracoccus sp. OH4464_COT-324]|uniref:hypothetical protein n=1 Tax=Tessaracoccus sp. OH4464_COT-324 TaxID=2491059 RepID=UPI000F63E3BC|nr:hypothetical protein [Tessaracoccus sp. OH4464_COT-324]RRD46087.1 hypothetical protein EII42_08445 [Tessaracoccus sp. OH4464_COT-324]